MMRTSYHTHTRWSDGSDGLEALIDGAVRAGLDELGVSDHYVVFADGHSVDWAMPPDFLDTYVDTVLRAARQAPVTLRLGIEVDYLPESIDAVLARLDAYPFDYRIGSVHFVDGFPVDSEAADWAGIDQAARNAVWRGYWARVRELAELKAFDFLGHLDLPKKFGYFPTIDLSAEIAAALDAIAAAGTAIELNTAGWRKPVGEAYPSLDILREARARNIPLVITADAHTPDDLTADYDRAEALARAAGYTSLARWAGRVRSDRALG